LQLRRRDWIRDLGRAFLGLATNTANGRGPGLLVHLSAARDRIPGLDSFDRDHAPARDAGDLSRD
jgi:hypothetical protein